MSVCPACSRPIAVARPRCLYCGAELPEPPAEPGTSPPDPGGEAASLGAFDGARPRLILVIDLAAAPATALERALSLSAYEAAMLARRGGWRLHGVLGEAAAEAERERLATEGLAVETVSEAEARVRPVFAFGGEREKTRLWLRTEEGELTLAGEDLLLVVRGPIAREYQPSDRRRRVGAAAPEEGYRVHLHRRYKPRPVEIDPANFEFGFAATGSIRLEIESWLSSLGDEVAQDDAFRLFPPALGVAEPEPKTALSAAGRLARARRDVPGRTGELTVLDNVAQFRFYSGWRAAVARRRAAPTS